MWNLKVPKILYLYWGKNKPLSYMKYLTAVSFSKLNPDWEINVFYPTMTTLKSDWNTNEQKDLICEGKDWFGELKNIKNLKLKEVDFKLTKEISEVHKSDLIRLSLLADNGGVWSDFDVFYTKPIDNIFVNKSDSIYDTFVCYHYEYNSIGFLMSAGNNKFFGELFKIAVGVINKKDELQYQNIGKDLYNYFFKYNNKNILEKNEKYGVNIKNIPFTTVYPFDWRQVELIFGNSSNLFENTIGIHWFAGSEKTSVYENVVTDENINTFDNFLLKEMSKI